jgi:hypothetical protein
LVFALLNIEHFEQTARACRAGSAGMEDCGKGWPEAGIETV